MEKTAIKIGTRGSQLALWQAGYVRKLLQAKFPELISEIVVINAKGDGDSTTAPAPAAQPGMFTGRIERALLNEEIDIAVHSLKDLPVKTGDGLLLAAVPERENPADALVSRDARRLDELPSGAKILTASPRRRALLLEQRRDVQVEGVRGNVPTRIAKMHRTGADGLVLAWAGLKRLGLESKISEILPLETFIPAPGQGALAVQTRAHDCGMRDMCAAIDHMPSRLCVSAERAFFHAIGAGCHAVAGAVAIISDNTLCLAGMVFAPDNGKLIRKKTEAEVKHAQDASQAGRFLAEEMRS